MTEEDKEQEIWVRFDTRRTSAGYTAVEVIETPRSDAAILAAMVAWGMDLIEFERMSKQWPDCEHGGR